MLIDMTFHSNRPERPRMPERTKRVSTYSQESTFLPYRRDGPGSARTKPSVNTLWEHAASQPQSTQPGALDHFNYLDVRRPETSISKSQISVNTVNGQVGAEAPCKLIPNDSIPLQFPPSQYIDPDDGFRSHSSPDSTTWQPGDVFTPNSSYLGSQSGDSLLPEGNSGSYGSFDSLTSSNPETLASEFSDNFAIWNASPTWASPLNNGTQIEDLNLPDAYFEVIPRSPRSFAEGANETSKDMPSEATYVAEPASWDPFHDFITMENENWMMVNTLQSQFHVDQEPSEPLSNAHVPWSPECPQHGSELNAGTSAFEPKPGYPHDVFKSREVLFRTSQPGRPYFGPQSSFLVKENSYGQNQEPYEYEIVPRVYESRSSQEPLEHVFSAVDGGQTPFRHEYRKRKPTAAERERTLEVRKDGACWPCHLLKTKCSPCSSGSPCEQCTRLVGKRRFCLLSCFNDPLETLHNILVPDRLFGHLSEASVEAFIGKHAIGWEGKIIAVQMSWGCRKLIDVNVKAFSLLDDSSELGYNHQAIANENGIVELVRNKCAPLGIHMADIAHMRKKYRCHIEDVVENELFYYVSIAYDDQNSKLPERLMEAVCSWYQKGSGDDEERALLRQAIEIHVASTILERSLILDEASTNNVQAHLGREYPVLSAPRGTQRQIKMAIFLEQHPRIVRVLKQWGKLMRSTARAEKNWPTAFCVFLVLMLIMDKTIASAQNFFEVRIKFRGRDAKSERETFDDLRRLMETNLFERCKEIFHCRYKTRKGGNERCNPVRDYPAAWRGDELDGRTARLIDDIQRIIQEFVPNKTEAEQRPVQTGYVMYTDLGRLARIFLADF